MDLINIYNYFAQHKSLVGIFVLALLFKLSRAVVGVELVVYASLCMLLLALRHLKMCSISDDFDI